MPQTMKSMTAPVLPYLRNATMEAGAGTPVSEAIMDWLERHGRSVGINLSGKTGSWSGDEDQDGPKRRDRTGKRSRWATIRSAILKETADLPADTCSRLELVEIGRMLGLDKVDIAILDLSLSYKIDNHVEQLWDQLSNAEGYHGRLTAKSHKVWSSVLGYDTDIIARRFEMSAPLVDSGIITFDEYSQIYMSNYVRRLLTHRISDPQECFHQLMGGAGKAELPWDDFNHLGECREHIYRILLGALQTVQKGINILILGPPGTGKTEFCKTIAAQLGHPIFSICEADGSGETPTPTGSERTAALRMAQKLACHGGPCLLLFDEAEDVLEDATGLARLFGGKGGIGSRVFFHRLLERTPVPVLWTANRIDGFSDAVLRRMTYILEMRVPAARVRERIWRRSLERSGISIGDDEISGLARDFEVAPALAGSAITAAKVTNGGAADIRRSLTSVMRAMSGSGAATRQADEPYDPALINADLDLDGIAECLAKAGPDMTFSMCLSGPPGTGKSAFAAHLADRLGMPLLRKRASDLLDMYVGQSEKNIARAFAEAESSHAILLFDEADSLLGSRQAAVRSWEVTQVNEMLTWMERHPLPFICTTNLAGRLDEAAARRFLFKARFDFLRPDQVVAAYVSFFAGDPPMGLETLTCLTPADFAIVKRKARLIAPDFEPVLLFRMLRQENALKTQAAQARNATRSTSHYGT